MQSKLRYYLKELANALIRLTAMGHISWIPTGENKWFCDTCPEKIQIELLDNCKGSALVVQMKRIGKTKILLDDREKEKNPLKSLVSFLKEYNYDSLLKYELSKN